MIKKVNSIVLFVDNHSKMKNWYKLLLDRSPIHSDSNITQFIINEVLFIIHKYQGDKEYQLQGGKIHVNFEVDSLKKTIKSLKEKNMVLSKNPTDEGFGYLVASIKDPENNEIDLLEKIQ